MEIAQSNTRNSFPLSTLKPIKKTITGSIALVFIFIFVIGFIAAFLLKRFTVNSSLSSSLIILGLIIFILIIIIEYIYQIWYFETYFYDLTDNFVIIRKGVFGKKEITTGYNRIQDVYMDQDILDRIFGLFDVHLSTATITSGMEAHIDGLDKTSADGLKTALLSKVQSVGNVVPLRNT